ncbi:MAG: nickel-dependent hydrogenase large subunit [Desulfamplus sp.]|nr:nickel-dependent hydrogenase large subunit [Desulfamplus sp.]
MSNIIKSINIPLNRVEGDLEIHVDMTDGVITDAWSCGTMYRGFEEMMTGRGVLDGLVITPRICGICSLSHLTAAVSALDVITGIALPDNAIRLCNLALMAEAIQSDMRQSVLMYMVDFINPSAYSDHILFEEAFKRYEPLKGSSVKAVVKETKRLIEVIAIIGGQWPHTSFMVPGGVTSVPEVHKILQCRMIINTFKNWYETKVLGCSIERWNAITSLKELYEWLEESQNRSYGHRESEVGFFLRFAMKAGIDKIGRGTDNFISYGNLLLPESTTVKGKFTKTEKESAKAAGNHEKLIASGFARGIVVEPFDQFKIAEDVSHSWYHPTTNAGVDISKPSSATQMQPSLSGSVHPFSVHPFKGSTKPYASGNSGDQYSWTKAPRYDGLPAETGPLAEMIIQQNPLFQDMIKEKGANAMARELARIVRPASLLPAMEIWLDELMTNRKEPFYFSIKDIPDGDGAGMMQAARGALGHWVSVKNNRISHYQIITPTAWNGSPRDSNNIRGPWEEALIGTAIKNPDNLIEAGHVLRSFDPCMVCSVH